MLRKYLILFGIIISILLLLVATLYYPGGSQYDKNSIGYDWKNNYISNLFGEKGVNGSDSASRFWAIPGMLFLCEILSIVCLLIAYYANYVYYTRNYLEFLPILQKTALAITITWILSLQYFTTITDFQSGKNVPIKIDDMSTNR